MQGLGRTLPDGGADSSFGCQFYWPDGDLVRTVIGQYLSVSDVKNDANCRFIRTTMPKPNLCRIIIHGKRHSREFVFESSQRIAFFLSLT
jgi:hypothetical protein